MTASPTHSRESLESVIAALRQIRADRRLQRELGLFAHDIDQAVAFVEERLDDEDVASSEQVYFNLK